jgi:hypothetical protein
MHQKIGGNKMREQSAEMAPTPGGKAVDKIKKFNWGKIKDSKGVFEEIDKSELYVDPVYQRSKWNSKKVNDIAAQWSWKSCGTLHVAIRNDSWWVFDGATRKLAADKRSDIKKLPCMVYDLDNDIAEEAGAFVAINNSKTVVASHDRFKALLVANDLCAVGLNGLFQSTGHKPGVHGGIKVIACLMTIWKLYKRDRQLLSEIWPLISDVNQECPIKDAVARSIFWTEVCARKAGTTLMDNPYRAFLIKRGGEFINAEIKREVTIIGRGGPRIEANALIKMLNKNKFKGVSKIKVME